MKIIFMDMMIITDDTTLLPERGVFACSRKPLSHFINLSIEEVKVKE